mmetsp:Transcript_22047/g.21230  ORF Transcript_22047/g.21230 Transcript_22047/m.21230 type:complete len:89 (+) Transcript_22047:155-421(+)
MMDKKCEEEEEEKCKKSKKNKAKKIESKEKEKEKEKEVVSKPQAAPQKPMIAHVAPSLDNLLKDQKIEGCWSTDVIISKFFASPLEFE